MVYDLYLVLNPIFPSSLVFTWNKIKRKVKLISRWNEVIWRQETMLSPKFFPYWNTETVLITFAKNASFFPIQNVKRSPVWLSTFSYYLYLAINSNKWSTKQKMIQFWMKIWFFIHVATTKRGFIHSVQVAQSNWIQVNDAWGSY